MRPTKSDVDFFHKNSWRFSVPDLAHRVSKGRWIPYSWLDIILRAIQSEIAKGGARIIVNAPPRAGKSLAFAKWLPVWFLSWYPEKRVIVASYSDSFAEQWGLKVRDEFERTKFCDVELRKDKFRVGDWETLQGGGMRSVGAKGGVTGRGADLFIFDDPHKDWEETQSPTIRQKVIDRFNADFYTRAEPGASFVIIQTRWHENDLTGYLLNEHEDDWQLISLPAIAEDNDPLGRLPGEPLCPERYTLDDLNRIKRALGSYLFNGLYQQRPVPPEGGLIKRDWFRRWESIPQAQEYVQSWDLTFKALGTSYVVGQVWARQDDNYYLLDQVRDKWGFTDQLKQIEILTNRWPKAAAKIIENAADAQAVKDTLKDSVAGIILDQPKGSKEARLAAIAPLIESGNVYLPPNSYASWVPDFVEEVVNFPNASNDDCVDAMSLALRRLSNKNKINFNLQLATGSRQSPWEFANAGQK